jgi:hypothetical protein
MGRADYGLATIFGVRPAGVAFDVLDRLGTPRVADAARRVIALAAAIDDAARQALAQLATELGEQRSLRAKLEGKLRKRGAISADRVAAHPWLAAYAHALDEHGRAVAELDALVASEYAGLHDVLVREATRELPELLLIESEHLSDEIARIDSFETAGHTSGDRKNDRTLALYLQRVCAKSDTISRFGPFGWGRVVPGDGIVLAPASGVARRCIELERWVVAQLIDRISADPAARAEARPRLHPNGRFEGDAFARHDEDRTIELAAAEGALARRCDGRTPAHALGEAAVLARLAELGVIRWEIERYAVDSTPFASLVAEVAGWRPGPLRDHWDGRLRAIGELVERFVADAAVDARRGVLAELRACLESCGVTPPDNQRKLYAARNPISENCLQDGTFSLGAGAVERMLAGAWPWFELFGDATAFAAARAFDQLREVIASAPRRGGTLSYATLARTARARGLALESDQWLGEAASAAYADLRRELSELLCRRPDAPEWRITADDCAVLRRDHRFPLGGELAYPSADLQIGAASVDDLAAGRVQWVVAELHYAFNLLQHSSYWACPDLAALHAGLRRAHGGGTFLVRDSFTQAPVHNSGEGLFAAMARPTFVGTPVPKPTWRTCAPADAEVVLDEERRDIRLRAGDEDLGSLIRTPRLHMAMHPFFPFEHAPHQPRLVLGDVVVQREAWYVTSAELGEPRPTGASASFVTAVERLRAARGIPRWVFVRPAPGVLGGANWDRDKDHKPLYVDLESVVFLDILERRLRKYGSLIVVEMLPDPRHLAWLGDGGRHVFELRTIVVPPERGR